MKNSINYLKYDEMNEINGGGFWSGLLGTATFHIIKEAYNDWGGHAQAFKNGRASVK